MTFWQSKLVLPTFSCKGGKRLQESAITGVNSEGRPRLGERKGEQRRTTYVQRLLGIQQFFQKSMKEGVVMP